MDKTEKVREDSFFFLFFIKFDDWKLETAFTGSHSDKSQLNYFTKRIFSRSKHASSFILSGFWEFFCWLAKKQTHKHIINHLSLCRSSRCSTVSLQTIYWTGQIDERHVQCEHFFLFFLHSKQNKRREKTDERNFTQWNRKPIIRQHICVVSFSFRLLYILYMC